MYCRGNPIKYADPSGYDIYPPGWDITGNTFKPPYTKEDTRAAIEQINKVLQHLPEGLLIAVIGKVVSGEGSQDKRLSKGEIKKLKDAGIDVEQLKRDYTGDERSSRYDLCKDQTGTIKVKSKSGQGEGEETDYNIKDY